MSTFKIKFKRRRSAVTNYAKRLGLAKSGIPRVVVRSSNRKIMGQIVKYEEKGDKVLAHADSNELRKIEWPSRSNRQTAYLTGMLLARKVAKHKVTHDFILDIGLKSPVKGSIPFVFAKGCIDGGMKLRSNLEIEEKLYTGTTAENQKKIKESNKTQYSAYEKAKIDPAKLGAVFAQTKEKIMKM